MADSAGISATTGQLLTDWAHVEQCVRRILSTSVGTRVMRRDFGSKLQDLVDAKMTQANVLAVYSAAAVAIEANEPRFRAYRASLSALGGDGGLSMGLFGLYFPRGHLGDYSVAEDASVTLHLT